MRTRAAVYVYTFCFLVLLALGAFAQDSSLSLAAYKSELARWSETVAALKDHPEQAPQVRAQIPSAFNVEANGKKFTVSNQWLNQGLIQFIASKPDHQADLLRGISDHFEQAQAEADLFAQPSPADGARQKLDDILSRREFSRVHGPSEWDVLLEKIKWRIIRFLDRIFSRVPSPAHGGQIFVWIVIAVALSVAAIWLKRTAAEKMLDLGGPVQFAPSHRGWRAWLAQARAAADESRWRDAVHLAYWAGISYLEQGGAWVPDRARTPREYLRLIAPGHQKLTALKALTQQFEVTWYGQRSAAATDFDQTIAHLEELGCR